MGERSDQERDGSRVDRDHSDHGADRGGLRARLGRSHGPVGHPGTRCARLGEPADDGRRGRVDAVHLYSRYAISARDRSLLERGARHDALPLDRRGAPESRSRSHVRADRRVSARPAHGVRSLLCVAMNRSATNGYLGLLSALSPSTRATYAMLHRSTLLLAALSASVLAGCVASNPDEAGAQEELHCREAHRFLVEDVGMAAVTEPEVFDDWRTDQQVPGCRVTAAGLTPNTPGT